MVEEKPKRAIRLESIDDEIFKQAFLELKESMEYALSNEFTFAYRCLNEQLESYKPRFNQLSHQSA